jgi:hypothetical protein
MNKFLGAADDIDGDGSHLERSETDPVAIVHATRRPLDSGPDGQGDLDPDVHPGEGVGSLSNN